MDKKANRNALRPLELRDDYESPALEAALLEGVHSPHRPYNKATLAKIKARALIKRGRGVLKRKPGAPPLAADWAAHQQTEKELEDRLAR